MLDSDQRLVRGATLACAIVFLTAGAYFGASRDFLSFLYSIAILPALFLISVTCIVVAFLNRIPLKKMGLPIALVVATPIAAYCSAHLRDPALFVVWASTHQDVLRQALRQDGIVAQWDSWGLAGMENDSYLAVDTQDAISTLQSAERWRKRLGLTCEVVDTHKMWPKLYIVTTSNCGLDAPSLP
jgi:hypothetical protein